MLITEIIFTHPCICCHRNEGLAHYNIAKKKSRKKSLEISKPEKIGFPAPCTSILN
jgi:hypothetical protein